MTQPQISLRGVTFGSPDAQAILATARPELKPCPFCSNPSEFNLATTQVAFNGTEVQVQCDHCGAKGPATPHSVLVDDWQIAAAKWNGTRMN